MPERTDFKLKDFLKKVESWITPWEGIIGAGSSAGAGIAIRAWSSTGDFLFDLIPCAKSSNLL